MSLYSRPFSSRAMGKSADATEEMARNQQKLAMRRASIRSRPGTAKIREAANFAASTVPRLSSQQKDKFSPVELLRSRMADASKDHLNQLHDYLLKVNFLAGLDPDVRMELFKRSRLEIYPEDSVIMLQGAFGDTFHVILYGNVNIYIAPKTTSWLQSGDHSGLFSPPPDKDSDDDEDDGHPVEYMRDACCVNPRTVESLFGVCVAKLNELKSFGELALQGKGLRAASIITSEEVGLMTVDKPTFDDILGSYNETQKQHKVAWFHAVQQGDTKKIRKLTNLGFSVETRLPSVEVFNRAPEFPGSHRFVDHFGTRCRRRSFLCEGSYGLHWVRDCSTLSVLCNHFEATGALNGATADLNVLDDNGMTPLHYQCLLGSSAKDNGAVIADMIRRGADPGIIDHNGFVCLHYANDPNTVAVLLREGAAPTALTKNSGRVVDYTCLHFADTTQMVYALTDPKHAHLHTYGGIGDLNADGNRLSIPETAQARLAGSKNSDGCNPLLYRIKSGGEEFGYRDVFTLLFASAAYRQTSPPVSPQAGGGGGGGDGSTRALASVGCAPPGWDPPKALRRAAGEGKQLLEEHLDGAAQSYGLQVVKESNTAVNGSRTRRPSTAHGPTHNAARPTRVHASHTPAQKALIQTGQWQAQKALAGRAFADQPPPVPEDEEDVKYMQMFQPQAMEYIRGGPVDHPSFGQSPLSKPDGSGYDYSGSKTAPIHRLAAQRDTLMLQDSSTHSDTSDTPVPAAVMRIEGGGGAGPGGEHQQEQEAPHDVKSQWSRLRTVGSICELQGSRLSDSKPRKNVTSWPISMQPKPGDVGIQDVMAEKRAQLKADESSDGKIGQKPNSGGGGGGGGGGKKTPQGGGSNSMLSSSVDQFGLVGIPDKSPTEPEKHVKRTPFRNPSGANDFLNRGGEGGVGGGSGGSLPKGMGNLSARRRSIMIRQEAIKKSAEQQPTPPLPAGKMHETFTTLAAQPQPPNEHPSAPSERPLHNEMAKGQSGSPATAMLSERRRLDSNAASGGLMGVFGGRRQKHSSDAVQTLMLSPGSGASGENSVGSSGGSGRRSRRDIPSSPRHA